VKQGFIASWICLITLASPARADSPRVLVELGGGLTAFTTSQSKVPLHLAKPDLTLEAGYRLASGLEVGLELSAAVTTEAGYRLIGARAIAKAPLWSGPIFELSLTTGAGVGSNPPILHHDLASESAATLWVKAGLDMRWWLPGDHVALGIDVFSQNLTMVGLNATVAVRFPVPY
jgi:hypothetical protein